MSRIGKLPVDIPEGVDVNISRDVVEVKGVKGTMSKKFPKVVTVKVDQEQVLVNVKNDTKRSREMHGTTRALISNMIKGVSEGWTRKLEIVGTGYKAESSGNKITLIVGYSHPVEIEMPEGISVKVEKTNITLEGIDKELVGQMAAKIRKVRPPEPYKGKGIKYEDEFIRRKPGKAAKGAEAA